MSVSPCRKYTHVPHTHCQSGICFISASPHKIKSWLKGSAEACHFGEVFSSLSKATDTGTEHLAIKKGVDEHLTFFQ